MKKELCFLRLSESNVDTLAAALSELHFFAYRLKREPAYWKWRYLDTPFGKSILIVAIRGSQVIGLYGGPYLPLSLRGKKVLGGLMGDFVIHPAEKSWRCVRGLVGTYYTETLKDNISLQFGLVRSHLIKLSQRFGVISLGHPPFYLGFLDLRRVLEGRFVPYPLSLAGIFFHPFVGLRKSRTRYSDLELRPVERFDAAFDELWGSTVKNGGIAVCKNAAYLNWRYRERPDSRFVCLAAYRKKGLEGLVVFCATGLRHGSLMLELMARNDDPGVLKALLLQTILELGLQKVGHITASFPSGSQTAVVLKDFGFKPWGARFWSNPEMVISSSFKESYPEANLKNWNFSLGDWS